MAAVRVFRLGRAHHHQRRGAVVDAAGVARRHRAVLDERRPQLRQRLRGGVVADELVVLYDDVALAALHRHCDDLVLEAPGLLRRRRLLLAGQRNASWSSRVI